MAAEPTRALDEIAEAVRLARRRGRCPAPVRPSVALHDHLDPPWAADPGWRTVWDVADHLAAARPDLAPPAERTEAEWVEAQVFVRVRAALADALDLDPGQVTRSARLQADLGAE
jgi:hypothetical protein